MNECKRKKCIYFFERSWLFDYDGNCRRPRKEYIYLGDDCPWCLWDRVDYDYEDCKNFEEKKSFWDVLKI